MKEIIRVHNLVKSYGKNRGVKNIDISISEGEWVGFIGPNGAGKSTLIRTLLGFVRPTGGSTEIFGMDSWKDRERIMEKVGYIPSEAIFYPEMSVDETLDYALDVHGVGNKTRKDELCTLLEVDRKKKIGELSYGNRKKVAIVSALSHSPSLLILDEPTGGLDPLMQAKFFSLLEEEHRKGTTIFMSSHILSEIEHHAERAIFIKEGEVILESKVSDMKGRSKKKVSVRGYVETEGVDGIREVKREGESISFLYSGSSDGLLEILGKGNVEDFTVTEPDLEEIFLHYYGKEERR